MKSLKQLCVPRDSVSFDIRYQRIEKTNWESCAKVLSSREKREVLKHGW